MIRMLELIWGEGFMAPGGPAKVDDLVSGLDLQGKRVLDIGSGLGGLVSGVILSKEGLKVCVLEKHHKAGGNLQTFSRDGCIFDTGMHYLGSLDEGQYLHKYFK